MFRRSEDAGVGLLGAPKASVDRRRQRQITRAARADRRSFAVEETPYRFAVASVVLPVDEDNTTQLQVDLLRQLSGLKEPFSDGLGAKITMTKDTGWSYC